jgi:hypothetical protein
VASDALSAHWLVTSQVSAPIPAFAVAQAGGLAHLGAGVGASSDPGPHPPTLATAEITIAANRASNVDLRIVVPLVPSSRSASEVKRS